MKLIYDFLLSRLENKDLFENPNSLNKYREFNVKKGYHIK